MPVELDVDVVVRDGQQHMDGRGLREERIRRKAEHEGRAVGCGGELIVAVAVSRGGRRDFFSPLSERVKPESSCSSTLFVSTPSTAAACVWEM